MSEARRDQKDCSGEEIEAGQRPEERRTETRMRRRQQKMDHMGTTRRRQRKEN